MDTQAYTSFDDLDCPLWGASQIGEAIGLPANKALYRLQHNQLPATRIGANYVTTRRRLLEAIQGKR